MEWGRGRVAQSLGSDFIVVGGRWADDGSTGMKAVYVDTRGYLTLGAFQLAYGQTNAFATKSTMADVRPHFDSAVRMLERAVDDVSSPPTDAELDTAFGTPAEAGDGFVALVDDNDADTAVYIVASNGSSWWYSAMTKAT